MAKKKNRTLFDMATFMLMSKDLAKRFCAEAISFACYISNRVCCRPGIDKIAYELWSGKKLTVKYSGVFGSTCYTLRDREHLENFDKKSDEALFLGYSNTNRAYRVFNKMTFTMEESINVAVDDHESTQVQVEISVVFSDPKLETLSANEIEGSQQV